MKLKLVWMAPKSMNQILCPRYNFSLGHNRAAGPNLSNKEIFRHFGQFGQTQSEYCFFQVESFWNDFSLINDNTITVNNNW